MQIVEMIRVCCEDWAMDEEMASQRGAQAKDGGRRSSEQVDGLHSGEIFQKPFPKGLNSRF